MTKVRTNISSGSPHEPVLGYSRAVRVGDQIFVAGTTSGGVGGDDAGEQTREILRRIGVALEQAGASFADVVRTRVFFTHAADFDAIGAVHGEVFGDIRPASSMIGISHLASPNLRVEIEVDAVV